jgi:hypothetical protein
MIGNAMVFLWGGFLPYRNQMLENTMHAEAPA